MAVTTVREAIAEALRAEGVEVLFALMGDGNLELICDTADLGVRVVFGRHEQGVVAMADGYARFTGHQAVATVTQGPGLTNTATSLAVTQRHPSPVLLLAGDVPLGDLHNPQGFQQAAFAALTAGAGMRLESGRSLSETLATAFATTGAGRPFVLNLPTDVQSAHVSDGWSYQPSSTAGLRSRPDRESIDAAAALLLDAVQPAVLAGRGAVASDAGGELAELARLLGAPLLTTLLANGLFAGDPLDAGVLGGLGDGRALQLMEDVDVLLSAGASLNQWTTHFGSAIEGKTIIRIDSDPGVLAMHAGTGHIALRGDVRATARALNEAITPTRNAPRLPSGGVARTIAGPRRRDPSPYLDTDTVIDPRHVLDELDGLLPGNDRRLVIGGGHSAQVACFTIGASSPADWSCTSTDFGAIGQGLGVAIGACFARPGQRVVHVTGDGDFMMGIAELDTAIRYSLPLTILVLNDQAMGQERHNLSRGRLPAGLADYASPDLAALADAFGATGYRITNAGELGTLSAAVGDTAAGVVIVDVRINGEYLNPVSRDIAEHLS
jgi:acetolactate synthase I/II/III large subunit